MAPSPHPRRNLHGPTPAMRAAALAAALPEVRLGLPQPARATLNRARAAIPHAPHITDTRLARFGREYIFPFLDEMAKLDVDPTPRELRRVLKQARDAGLLLPRQYQTGKTNALPLIREWKRRAAAAQSGALDAAGV